jgi:hypothetical protein
LSSDLLVERKLTERLPLTAPSRQSYTALSGMRSALLPI